MRHKSFVLSVLVLGLTFASAVPSSAATTKALTFVNAGSSFLPSTPNALHAQVWGVGVSWSVRRTQPAQISVRYSTCFPFRHYLPPCQDRGASFEGVIPHHAFRITKMVDTACMTCDTFTNHRTVAAARLDATVLLIELTDRPNPRAVRAHVRVKWIDCRDTNGGYHTMVTGTLTVGGTPLDGVASRTIEPYLDAANADNNDTGTQPSVAELPLCTHGTPQ